MELALGNVSNLKYAEFCTENFGGWDKSFTLKELSDLSNQNAIHYFKYKFIGNQWERATHVQVFGATLLSHALTMRSDVCRDKRHVLDARYQKELNSLQVNLRLNDSSYVRGEVKWERMKEKNNETGDGIV